MSGHSWRTDVNGAHACCRCPVRKGETSWQRKKGSHWRPFSNDPLPPCMDAGSAISHDTKALLLKAWLALDGLPSDIRQATEAATTMHNIKSLLAEHGVKVPR